MREVTEKERDNFYIHVDSIVRLICTKCGEEETVENMDLADLDDDFILESGWRATDKHLYCKKCAKKHLKKKR